MIRILLAEDMVMIRGALVALLNHEPDLEVVAEVSTGDAIVPAALAHRPDVAVLDFDLPGGNGLDAAVELHARLPECRVLILTGMRRPGLLRRALLAKVSGYLLKDAPPERLAEAIRRIAAGETVIDPKLAADTLSMPPSPLTPRETDVLRLLAGGAGSREIATKLSLSAGTVRNYQSAALMKLNARNTLDAIRIAQQADWI